MMRSAVAVVVVGVRNKASARAATAKRQAERSLPGSGRGSRADERARARRQQVCPFGGHQSQSSEPSDEFITLESVQFTCERAGQSSLAGGHSSAVAGCKLQVSSRQSQVASRQSPVSSCVCRLVCLCVRARTRGRLMGRWKSCAIISPKLQRQRTSWKPAPARPLG